MLIISQTAWGSEVGGPWGGVERVAVGGQGGRGQRGGWLLVGWDVAGGGGSGAGMGLGPAFRL